MESNLKLYSLGIVVETKLPDSDIILVSPIEVLNIQPEGDIKSHTSTFKGDLSSVDDAHFKTEIRSKNYLRAKWIPFGHSNRVSAPDVVANETVLLFKYEDVDEYYWSTIFREPELRRLEKVIYAYSNLRSGIGPYHRTTSYWVEVNTRDKLVHLHTSKNDGELTDYDISIDTKNGVLNIKDGHGNHITLNSKEDTIDVKAVKEIKATAGKQVTITAPDIVLNGNLRVNGNIHSTGSVTDEEGNTNHHVH